MRLALLVAGLALSVSAVPLARAQEPFGRPAPLRPSNEEAEARDEEQEAPQATGDSRRVVLGIDGDLAAGAHAARFTAGLHAAFAEEEFRAERSVEGGGWKSAGRARNRFKLFEGDDTKDAWLVTLVADSLPDSTGRGAIRVVIGVLSPQAVKLNARPLPLREDLIFDPAAMKLDFASAAGRVAALRVLERLHHLDGQLEEKTRLSWPGRASSFAKPAAVE